MTSQEILSPSFDMLPRPEVLADVPFWKYQSMPGINASILKEQTPHEMWLKFEAMHLLPALEVQRLEGRDEGVAGYLSAVAEQAPLKVPRNYIVKGNNVDEGKLTPAQERMLAQLSDDPIDARELHTATLNKVLDKGWAKIVVKEEQVSRVSEEVKETRARALTLGDMIHKAVLEPNLIDSEHWKEHYQLSPTNKLTGKKAEEAREEAPHLTLITSEIYETAFRCRDSVWGHNEAARLLMLPGKSEVTMRVWDDDNLCIRKCRVDRLPDDIGEDMIELKSTRVSLGPERNPYGIKSEISKRRYDLAARYYFDIAAIAEGKPRKGFSMIWVQNEAPFLTRVVNLTDAIPEISYMQSGLEIYREQLARFAVCYHQGCQFEAYQNEGAFALTR